MIKLRDNLQYAIELNDFFDEIGESSNDMDIMCTYIAANLFEGEIDMEQVCHIPKLVLQISKKLEQISKKNL